MRNLIKNIFASWLIIVLSTGTAVTGQTLNISGRLFDKEEGRIISNGTVFLNPGNLSTITNLKGEYSFSCPAGIKQLSTQILGYRPAAIDFTVDSDTIINIYLEVSPFELGEVTVTGEQVKNVRITHEGNFIVTPEAMRETPRLFSEPDLLKSLQLIPGVVAGKDGSSDIYVRGGGAGQNIILANGCYFFLPSHFLRMISPVDFDFLENAELYKDYFPAELGGGAGSVINLQFKKSLSDSLHAQLRFGMLSSGFTFELPLKKSNLDITAGLKRGNYSVYLPYLREIVSEDISMYLPSNGYAFYDGFLNVAHSSEKLGKINYLFFGNYDKGKEENELTTFDGDTLIFNLDRISDGWSSMVHALQWEPPVRNRLKWKFNLNYNRLSINREIYHRTEKHSFIDVTIYDVVKTSFLVSPTSDIIGSSMTVSGNNGKLSWTAGVSDRIRFFSPDIISDNILKGVQTIKTFGENTKIFEPAVYFSSALNITEKLLLDAGLRISGAFTKGARFVIPEPRIRLSYNLNGSISPHINYVRLSQFDHSVEGTNAGLRSMLWLPISGDFGPEISDVVSAGFQGHIKNQIVWTVDCYYKKIKGMLDYKSGASFVYDTSFTDLLDVIHGKAYGLEAGMIKRTGRFTGSISYTYSRSKQEWGAPQGLIWIPANADRPHNFNLAVKYHLKTRTSFGLNWVYQSGAPATIYMHESSYGKFFNSKNNIRYFDYHRLDLSLRQIIHKRKYTISVDADIYNVYNRKNTFYFKEAYDGFEGKYYFKNVTLFPVMPTLTITIKY
jgi:hypothetical protein